MNARQYNHDVDDAQHLFASIIESLSSSEPVQNVTASILTKICRHFKFGWGFVYEADHTRTFSLKERFTSDETNPLPESFILEEHLSAGKTGDMLRSSVYSQNLHDEVEELSGLSGLFGSNSVMLTPIADDDGRVIGLIGIMDRRRNILMNERAVRAAKMTLNLLGNHIKLHIFQKRLEYTRESLVGILDNTGVDIYVNDFLTHEILYVNKSMARPYGGLGNMLGKKCWQVLYNDKTEQCGYCPKANIIDAEGNPTKIYSWDYQRPFDGAWFRVLSAAFRWVDGRLAHIVSSVDITENKNNEATIAYMANYDALTNLPNRRKLRSDYEKGGPLAEDGDTGYLLFFDLDDFKKLNDSMGHQAGDELLAQISYTLSLHSLTSGHLYRHGGDEFILLYRKIDREQALRIVNFLLARFEQPWTLQNASTSDSIVCRASIGVVDFPDGPDSHAYPDGSDEQDAPGGPDEGRNGPDGSGCHKSSGDGKTLDELLHSADLMMYKAKKNGGGIACFSDGVIITP